MKTNAIKVLLADDEAPARERLRRLVEELDGWALVAACGTSVEALELVRRHSPAVVLLDIRMPGMSGIEVARHLTALDAPPAVVFTTAYDQYALDAFDSRAVGYLLKPVRRERLEAALRHAARVTAPSLRDLTTGRGVFAPRAHIAVRDRDELKLIPMKSVVFFRADLKYVTIHHEQGVDLLEESLRDLEKEFADDFVRTHRSLLVAVARIEALERRADGGCWVRIRGSTERLPVSRRQLSELKARLNAGR
jgi:two-component system response regulator AlgR